jgi:hypothetical protein
MDENARDEFLMIMAAQVIKTWSSICTQLQSGKGNLS